MIKRVMLPALCLWLLTACAVPTAGPFAVVGFFPAASAGFPAADAAAFPAATPAVFRSPGSAASLVAAPALFPAAASTASTAAASTFQFNADAHFRYILRAQRSTGAIAMVPEGSAINPYFANLAALALLRAPGHLDAVQRYMDWYLSHLNPDGTIDDFRVEDGQEISTGDADSTDSYAATLLTLADAWVEAGGDPAWAARHQAGLKQVAGAILAVTDSDGLTRASPTSGSKLLMDNCEVYQGWLAWSRLLDRMGARREASAARLRAERTMAGLGRFRQRDGRLAWAIGLFGRQQTSGVDRFYPDAVAQVFPLIWGVTGKPDGYLAMDTAQPAWRSLEAGDFPWLLPAYAAARAGDTEAAGQALAAVEDRYPDLGWPWFVAESAWVIQTAAQLPPLG